MLPDEVASGYKAPGCAIRAFPRSTQSVQDIIQVLQLAHQPSSSDSDHMESHEQVNGVLVAT